MMRSSRVVRGLLGASTDVGAPAGNGWGLPSLGAGWCVVRAMATGSRPSCAPPGAAGSSQGGSSSPLVQDPTVRQVVEEERQGQGPLAAAGQALNDVVERAAQGASHATQGVRDGVSSAFERAETAVDASGDAMDRSMDRAQEQLSHAAGSASSGIEGAMQGAKETAVHAAERVADAAKGAAHRTKEAAGLGGVSKAHGFDPVSDIVHDPAFQRDQAEEHDAAKLGVRSGPGGGSAF